MKLIAKVCWLDARWVAFFALLILTGLKLIRRARIYLFFYFTASQKSKAGKPSTPWDPPRNTTSNPIMYHYFEWDALVMPEVHSIVFATLLTIYRGIIL